MKRFKLKQRLFNSFFGFLGNELEEIYGDSIEECMNADFIKLIKTIPNFSYIELIDSTLKCSPALLKMSIIELGIECKNPPRKVVAHFENKKSWHIGMLWEIDSN